MTKICSICKSTKDASEFNKHPNRKDGLQSHCRECNRIRSKEYYKRNPKKHIRAVNKRRSSERVAGQKLLMEYLSFHHCVDCGESDPVVLEFDHVRGRKVRGVAKFVQNGYSWEKTLAEIAKCEVVCANCHRRRTYTRCNSYRTTPP